MQMRSKVQVLVVPILALGLLVSACEAGESDGDSEGGAENGDTEAQDEDNGEEAGDGDAEGEDGKDSEDGQEDGENESDEDSAEESDDAEESAEEDEGEAGEESGDEWDTLGECRIIGEGKFEDGSYTGKVAHVLLADRGNGEELCRVEFTIETTKDSPYPCDECYWSTFVKIMAAETITDSEGRCANSERGLDEAAIAAIVGQEMGFAFAEERTGHGEVLLLYKEGGEEWEEESYGDWDEASGDVTYENIQGFCAYPG